MNLWRKCLIPLIAMSAMASLRAQEYSPQDVEEVVAEVETPRNESVIRTRDTLGKFSIGGDVRAKYARRSRKTNGVYYNGSSEFPSNVFESKATLIFSLDSDRSWGGVKIEFKNTMGIQNATKNGLNMRRAYVGYDLYLGGTRELWMEVGRQELGDLFESQLQFDTRFDGILLGYDYTYPCYGSFFVHGGPCIVDSKVEQYAWIGETGVTEIAETGLYLKYSFAHWKKNSLCSGGFSASPQYRYDNSQITMGYVFKSTFFCVPARVSGAFIYNHAAKKTEASLGKRRNEAFYVMYEMGKLSKPGDWSVNMGYEYVQMYAIPQYDLSGMGRGFIDGTTAAVEVDPTNPANYSPAASSAPDNASPAEYEGNTNYQGLFLGGAYNLTSNLSLRADLKGSKQLERAIGGKNTYKYFEISAVYNF